MKIAVAADHAGFEYKNHIFKYLTDRGFQVHDFGTYSQDSVDYPDFVHPLATAIENKEFDFGFLFCGSGEGVSITANKHAGIRCALCWQNDIAKLSRQHNNANVMAIPTRFIAKELAQELVDTFLSTQFEGGRHETRVEKISKW
ncbi:ribose 5-phosphate isomerase B [Apibacter muscae]|uniref:Ribose 5-phosphate isomerase B n=1 Tax=Apibacter muscae TaxID=2509004 RepID=A0A563DGS1_9FLAO|nr:ribose 5-phosphate isomerase B [Apibacter muscae]TWP29438.1 ribose 5-phosphate isomerase B [Apibacter muscae]TWP30171.1 ribose 5-phosphate isomerase B [Apibacter muscae]